MSKMYYIIDNSGNLSKKSFKNDFDALCYFINHWKDYVTSCLSCDHISVANENKLYIFEINTATGYFEFTKYFQKMKKYKSTIGSLVDNEIYTWPFQAVNEEDAFNLAYEHWENKNYVDHGTMNIEEIGD